MQQQITRLLQSRLPRIANDLERLIAPAISVIPHPVENEDEIPKDASRMGGSPNLPPQAAWPYWNEVPLSFLAQLNLKDVVPYDVENKLPKTGMLYFFYAADEIGPTDPGTWKVIYYDGDLSKLVRTSIPGIQDTQGTSEDEEQGTIFEAASVDFASSLTLPSVTAEFGDGGSTWFIKSVIIDDEDETYYEVLEEAREMQPGAEYGAAHQILGYPYLMQVYDLESVCQEAWKEYHKGGTDIGSVEDWLLLFQIDSDENLGMDWVDNGLIYYWIRRQDLEVRNFDNVWSIMQFG